MSTGSVCVVVVDPSVPKSCVIGLVGSGPTTLHQSQMVSILCTRRVEDRDMCCSRCIRMESRSDTREPLIYQAGQLNSTITNSDIDCYNIMLSEIAIMLGYVYISLDMEL